MNDLLRVDELAVLRRRTSAKWSSTDADVLPLPVAEMDFALAPPVANALRAMVDASDTGYAYAEPVLGDAVAAFAGRRWGWDVDPAQVSPAADVAVGAVELLRVLCPGRARVVVNPPVYPPFYLWVRDVGADVLEVPLQHRDDGGWRLDLDALEQAFRQRPAAYVLCNPHNPVGRVHDADELAEVARLAAAHGVVVIADEVHAPLVLPGGARHTPFLTVPGGADVGIALVSASKAFNLAGLKCAAVVTAGPDMAAVARRVPDDHRWRVGQPGLLATLAAFRDGDAWLDRLLATLAARRDQLASLLTKRMPAVRWHPPAATYLAWLDCRDLDPREIRSGEEPQRLFLERGRVALEAGAHFGTGGAGWVRLNYATSEQILDEAVTRMAAATG